MFMETRSAAIHRKMPASACQLPITGSAHKAAIVGDGRVGTGVVLATHDVPTECRRAAALDRAHHLELAEAHVTAVGVTPSGAVVAEDIRDLQGWTTHEGPALCRQPLRRQRQPIERAQHRAQHVGGDVGIAGGGVQLGMAQRTRVIMHLLLTH
jgi:hypothetical protein